MRVYSPEAGELIRRCSSFTQLSPNQVFLSCFHHVDLHARNNPSCLQGAGANILRAVAGAGVLSGYDKLQVMMFGKKYGGGGG